MPESAESMEKKIISDEQVVTKLNELLNEEKWTRATLNNYTIKNFTELDALIEEAKKAGKLKEIRELCNEHLIHTPNSIIALYVIGKLNFEEEALDEGHILKLINLFMDNKRFNIVEFLANEMLKYGENKEALNALAQVMINDNREKELIQIWERLVKIDYDEADIAKKLAVIKEKENDIEGAVEFYKKALLRYLKKGMYNPVEEIWLKLVDLIPEDTNFFISTEKRIADAIGKDKAAFLLSFLIPYYKDSGEYDTALEILKRIISYNPKDREAREEIVDCYRKKYAKHSLLEEYIKKTGLDNPTVDIQQAMHDFENRIVFDVGGYVYHRKWGIGKCREIKEGFLIIDFKDKPGHKMTLEMALNSLQTLPEDHIWLLKLKNLDELREKILNNIEEGLKIVIKSKNNAATVKDIKEELLNGVLTKSEWTKWWNKAKNILKKNPYFGTLHDNNAYYIRKKPISYDEDIYTRFKNEKNFDKRMALLQEYIEHGDLDTEFFEEMLDYFKGFLSSGVINENTIKSFLLLKKLKREYTYLPIEFQFDFDEILKNYEEIHKVLPTIQDNDLKKDMLILIKKFSKDWPEIYIKCFYEYPMKFIIDELISNGKKELVSETVKNIVTHYREFPEIFIWITKNLFSEENEYGFDISKDQIIMGLTHILDITGRELINERNVVYNRKIFNTIVDILFKDNLLIDYIKSTSEDKVKRLIPIIFNIEELKDEYIIKLKFAIKTTFPQIVFDDEVENISSQDTLLVTQRSYELKQIELKYLLEHEIPQNSKEIGIAMEKGDLRENAEYKFALEKQEFLKQQVKKLQESLNKARILKPEEIKTNVVSVGTMITLMNLENEKTEKYTILGPWESDPSKKIISYTSPLGETLMNKSVGDTIEIATKGKKKKYKILKIERALI